MDSRDEHAQTGAADRAGSLPRPSEAAAAAHACRFLALAPDPSTLAMFACEEHRCFRAGEPLAVALDYQAAVCLRDEHASCPRFRDAQSPIPLQPRRGWWNRRPGR